VVPNRAPTPVPVVVALPKVLFLALIMGLAPPASSQEEGPPQDPPPVEFPPAMDPPDPAVQEPAPEESDGEEDSGGQQLDALVKGWAYVLDRDARTGFPRRVADVVIGQLAPGGELSSPNRAAALVALGASRVSSARGTLEAWASEGSGEDRLGAILGLGELGLGLGDADLILVDLLQDGDPLVRECALLALLRSGQAGWRELAAGLADEPDHPLAGDARALIAFVDDPRSALPPHRACVRLLNTRWLAARRFGTVDGRAWESAMLESLASNDRFLDEIVLGGCTELHFPGITDHIQELLLKPGAPVRVRAAVRVMPRELDLLVAAGLWTPDGDAEWQALLDEGMAAGVLALMPTVLERATRQRSVAPAAAAMLVRQDERHEDMVLAAMGGRDPRGRSLACRGAGESGLERFIVPLQGLKADGNPGVRGAALTARLQLGDLSAGAEVREVFTASSGDRGLIERSRLRDALARAGRSGELTAFLTDLAQDLEGVDRADLLAILSLRGRMVDGAELRDAWSSVRPGSPTALRLIEGLSLLPTPADLDFLATLFPLDDQPDANVALALGLIRNGHKEIEPVLRGAVWRGPLDRSVLAAAVVKKASGLRTLQHWVLKPPPEVSSADIRRVGFAIGKWGGIEAIHDLQERLGGVAGADRPALQGAFLGAMAARTQ
jgi:HEAT repeat protein